MEFSGEIGYIILEYKDLYLSNNILVIEKQDLVEGKDYFDYQNDYFRMGGCFQLICEVYLVRCKKKFLMYFNLNEGREF